MLRKCIMLAGVLSCFSTLFGIAPENINSDFNPKILAEKTLDFTFLNLVLNEKIKFLADPCSYTPTETITVGNRSANLHRVDLESKPLQHALRIEYIIGEQRHYEQVNGGFCKGSHDANNHTLTLASYVNPTNSTSHSSIIPEPRYPHTYCSTLESKSDVRKDSDSDSSFILE